MTLDDPAFPRLIEQLRAGDERAARRIVEDYGRTIQIMVRARLVDRRLRRVLDSMDVCQSVMGSFFVRAAIGQFELESPRQLVALLTTMAEHKVYSAVRRLTAQRRDVRQQVDDVDLEDLSDIRAANPSRQVELRELFEQFQASLTEDERVLVDLRRQGASWNEVALRAGSSPEAVRKRVHRATARVLRELEFDEGAPHA